MRRLAIVLVVAVLAGLGVGCTAGKEPRGASSGGQGTQANAGPDGAVRGELRGVAVIAGGPGSLTTGATLLAEPTRPTDVPLEIDGVEIGQTGVGVRVTFRNGRLLQPISVTFPAKAGPGESLVGLHRSDDGVWQLLPATPSSDSITVTTDHFSVVTWAVAKLLKPVGDFLAAKLAGRTSPPDCKDGPSWVSVTSNPSGSTHSCMRAGKALADGTAIAELEIKSNRGTYQWVQLPSTLPREYVWVEDQSEFARSLVRAFWRHGGDVLLGPGQAMTVGYRQPTSPAQVDFHTYVDSASALQSMGHLFVDAVTDDAFDKVGGYLVVMKCFGILKIDLTNLNSPVELKKPDLLIDLPQCLIDVVGSFADPKKVVAAASDILGPTANGDGLTSLSQGTYKLGKLAAKVAKIIEYGSYILKELAFIVDELAAGIGAPNATAVSLNFLARTEVPVLGVAAPWGPASLGAKGFGEVRPAEIFYGGDPLGDLSKIKWSSWGGATAEGNGQAPNYDHSVDGTVAGAPTEPAHVVAWDLTTCDGKRTYRKVQWYFGDKKWKATDHSYNLCTGP